MIVKSSDVQPAHVYGKTPVQRSRVTEKTQTELIGYELVNEMSAVGFKSWVTASQLIKHQNQINKMVYRSNLKSQKSKKYTIHNKFATEVQLSLSLYQRLR